MDGPVMRGAGGGGESTVGTVAGIGAVAVVGAGTMGAGIAQLCLLAGLRVALHDTDPVALGRGRERVAAGLERLVEKGRLDPGRREELLATLRLAPDLAAAVADAHLVIEAVVEDLAVKLPLLRDLDARCAPAVLLATNTSSLSVADLARATGRPDRVVGIHFFNPAPVLPLVEVVATDPLAPANLERAVAFVAGLGKSPLVCRDAPGFVVNRVGRPFTCEALRMLDAGQAGVADVDSALEGAGYPMGPFRLIDLIGVDVDMAIDEALSAAFGGSRRFAPSPTSGALIEAGQLGRKTGRGFHAYDASGRAKELAWSGPAIAHPLSAEAIVERIELAVINEAYRAVEESVALPGDVDTAMRLGAGHPIGPFERAGRLGLRHVVERLRALDAMERERSGEQYEVASLLWTVATV